MIMNEWTNQPTNEWKIDENIKFGIVCCIHPNIPYYDDVLVVVFYIDVRE